MATARRTRGKKSPKKPAKSRSTSGKEAIRAIDEYVRHKNAKLESVANAVRLLVRKTLPRSREAVNAWGIPTFNFNGPLCYMMLGKHHLTFGFTRGTSLADDAGLLEGTGKNLRHVKLKEIEQLRDANLRQLLLEAAALNEGTPLTDSMRVKKNG
jgi:hypothetical protein